MPDQTDLHGCIAAALLARIKQATISKTQPHDAFTSLLAANEFDLADAVLAVLPPAADRAAIYREVADRLAADAETGDKEGFTRIYRRSAAKQVREWAAEAQQQEPEPPCCSDPTCTCVQVNAEGLCECVKWDEAQQQPETHSCGNCEGVDPDTCLVNPTRAEEHRG